MDTHILWLQFTFVLFGVGIWFAITLLLSYVSGWALLARFYRAAQPFAGRYERVRASQMGPLGPFGGARNALYVGIDPQGLHLRMFILFRLNCRDLFMPWAEISVTRGRSFFLDFVEFHFRQAPRIRVRIFGKAGDVIKALALGARGVMIGKAFLYGLGAGGEQGVRTAIELIRRELDVTMALTGQRTLERVDSSLIWRP